MADSLSAQAQTQTQAQVQTQTPQGQYKIEKSEKSMGQNSNRQLGKRKEIEEP